MNFHDTAVKYAQLASASVDSHGNLVGQVGAYPAGTVRDAELQSLEDLFRASVYADLVNAKDVNITAHVVLSQEDGGAGAETQVIGICFDPVDAENLAEKAAASMCSSINKLLASDMGDDFEPVGVTQVDVETRIVSNSGAGVLGAINIKTTTAIGAEQGGFGICGGYPFGASHGAACI